LGGRITPGSLEMAQVVPRDDPTRSSNLVQGISKAVETSAGAR
jgi:hypothetical protein